MNKTLRQELSRFLCRVAESSWFAYASIVMLQLKVMFWIWDYRDLTPGDASSYYRETFTWLDESTIDIIWSPVYTVFLLALQHLTDNPFWVSIIAQIIVAVSTTLLVLALLRRLLPSHIAWIIAAWWAILPINFDTVYNVHLFSALFPLALFVVATYSKNVFSRGIVLGGLLLTAILVRNEYGALFVLWLLVSLCHEYYLSKHKGCTLSLRKFLLAYGLPVAVVLLVISIFCTNSFKLPEMVKTLEAKHTVNVCQIYAYNRIQQGDPWNGDPWTGCQDLMTRDFGSSSLTLSQAFFLNPRAVLQHLWWNIKLIPDGTQLALFNSYSGGTNPDYMLAKQSRQAWVPYLFVLALSVFAGIVYFVLPLFKKRHSFENSYAWLLMSCAALLVLGVIIMQRPRPSYMFPYALFIMALSGLGLHKLFELVRASPIVKSLLPIASILLIIFVPFYYNADYVSPFGYKGQGLRNTYDRVAPHIDRTHSNSSTVLVTMTGDYNFLCNYLGITCQALNGDGLTPDEILGTPVSGGSKVSLEEDTYILYLENMIGEIAPRDSRGKDNARGYVRMNCLTPTNNVLSCGNTTVDLKSGTMNDGYIDIPLRSVLYINDGYVVDSKDYSSAQGYYLQILMKNNKIEMILMLSESLFRTGFNQQYLLGNYDRRYFEEAFNDFPETRIFKVKAVNVDDLSQ